ncbi:hypothetical protein BC937DRAFT_86779 [Endogone sp. FLAS-F59071]|nr:hypothetical protein BC937DRAFT_86779 [Endogone sp. FLAS-F59071]|eukprot:RUS19874.1 hypothetical protein BC937DRAFT_86779 [Endogone sp. FLAS-F59071]
MQLWILSGALRNLRKSWHLFYERKKFGFKKR